MKKAAILVPSNADAAALFAFSSRPGDPNVDCIAEIKASVLEFEAIGAWTSTMTSGSMPSNESMSTTCIDDSVGELAEVFSAPVQKDLTSDNVEIGMGPATNFCIEPCSTADRRDVVSVAVNAYMTDMLTLAVVT
eukprot:TRINITY_DN3470_c0_g2_i1.p2 TRINITY_DN3470_c0_g2~~TRINITY_DN3470_c0_g2_i1.p2  ORF type:complete len:135 (+),score=20.91 TRINITY_DN3470_c0_g2_i1:19-423(+)